MTRPIDPFLTALDQRNGKPKRNGSGYMAKCPAHEDKKPSLSISESDMGLVLLHCHAGCTPDAIVAALGLEMSDLFPGDEATFGPSAKTAVGPVFMSPVPEDAPRSPAEHPKLGKPTGRWKYLDAEGRTLYLVLRFDTAEGKEIRVLTLWREPDGTMTWKWKHPPAPRALYGLHALPLAPDADVLVVEGEKTADAAQRLFPDLVAVTSSGGSNAAGKANWAALKGRSVVIWPDHDEPGQKYAAEVGRLVLNSGAHSVRFVSGLKGRPKGWDLADDTHDGETVEDLRQMIEGAKVKPSGAWTSTGGTSWAEDRLVEVIPPKILVGPMVVPSWMHLYSAAGSGKTLISLALGLHAASGTNLLDWAVREPVKVLYVDGELSANIVRQRVHDLIQGHGLDEDLIAKNLYLEGFDRQDDPLPPLGSPPFREVRHKYPEVDLLIVDNVRTLTALDFSENEAEAWAPINENLKYLRSEGLSIITNHHGNRAGGFNGSAAQGTLADLLIKVKRHNANGSPFPLISFEAEKNRHGGEIPSQRWELYEPAAGGLAWGSGGSSLMSEADATKSESNYRARIVAEIESNPGIGKSKLYKAVRGRHERFEASVEVMVTEGTICRDTKGKKHRHTLPIQSKTTSLKPVLSMASGIGPGSATYKPVPPKSQGLGTGMGLVESSTGPTDPAPFRESGMGSVGGPPEVPSDLIASEA